MLGLYGLLITYLPLFVPLFTPLLLTLAILLSPTSPFLLFSLFDLVVYCTVIAWLVWTISTVYLTWLNSLTRHYEGYYIVIGDNWEIYLIIPPKALQFLGDLNIALTTPSEYKTFSGINKVGGSIRVFGEWAFTDNYNPFYKNYLNTTKVLVRAFTKHFVSYINFLLDLDTELSNKLTSALFPHNATQELVNLPDYYWLLHTRKLIN